MAIQKATVSNDVSRWGGVKQVSWALLGQADSGDWVNLADFSGKTFQISGTFGAAGSVTIEGSNDLVPTNAAAMSDWQANALTATTAKFMTARDMPIWVRPRATAGDGTTAILVTLAAHRQDISLPG